MEAGLIITVRNGMDYWSKYKKQIEKDEEIAEELQDRDQSYRRAEDQNT